MLAAKLLHHLAKKDPEKTLSLIKIYSAYIQDWAICDTLGMQSCKNIFKSHQKEIFVLATRLNKSSNFWQRRLSLVLVEWYTRDKRLHKEINELVERLENDETYYVQKAVSWIKRNMKKGR
jgi:3-methyladenine DNA glycosylase AlkD